MASTTSTSRQPVSFAGNACKFMAHPLLPSLPGPTSKSSRYLHILMSTMQQAKPPPSKRKQMHTFFRRPTCTHLSMVRLYGPHACQFCGRTSSLGWVYVCRDEETETVERRQSLHEAESLPSVSDDSDYFEVQALVAESLNMSPSVVQGIRECHYSYDQIDKLIRQKEDLVNAIWRVQNQIDDNADSASCTSASSCSSTSSNEGSDSDDIITHSGSATSPAAPDTPIIVNGSVWPLPQNTSNEILLPKVYTPPSRPQYRPEVKKALGCGFQACHTCRPYVYERIFVSFESALNNEEIIFKDGGQLSDELPVYDANIVRNLGLRKSPPPRPSRRSDHVPVSHYNYYLDQDDLSSDDDDWAPTSDESEADDESCPKCPDFGPCLACGRGFPHHYGMHDVTITQKHQQNTSTDSHTADTVEHLHRVGGRNNLWPPSPPPQAPRPPPLVHHSSSTISLPTTKTISTLTPPSSSTFGLNMNETHKARSVCGVSGDNGKGAFMWPSAHYRNRSRVPSSRNSMVGEEVEVEGGVALTEEAVENYVPDVFD